MLILPFRAKNPPESTPYCTIGLIAINVLVYLCTTRFVPSVELLVVRDDALSALAISHNTFSAWRLITSMFLHGDIFHIGGNMLFLAIFGTAVEGRLRSGKFLAIYFAAGIVGGILTDVFFGAHEPDVWNLGASGAIMGVLGAYLYMFPFSYISIYFGMYNWQAVWLIGFFIAQDIISGSLGFSGDGVNHIAHLSGFALGYLMAMGFRVRTDSQHVSEVKSTLDDIKDVQMLSLRELEILLRTPTSDAELVMAYCNRCMIEGGAKGLEKSVAMIKRYQRLLVEEADPSCLSAHLLGLPPNEAVFPSVIYLRLGSRLEQAEDTDLAARLYRRIYDIDRYGRDSEIALFRVARLLETAYDNPEAALDSYKEMLRLFPNGSRALEGRQAVERINALFPTDSEEIPKPAARKLELIPQPIQQLIGSNPPQGAAEDQPEDPNTYRRMLEL